MKVRTYRLAIPVSIPELGSTQTVTVGSHGVENIELYASGIVRVVQKAGDKWREYHFTVTGFAMSDLLTSRPGEPELVQAQNKRGK